jgi:hypothetical protein
MQGIADGGFTLLSLSGRTKRNGIALGKTSFPMIGKSLSSMLRPVNVISQT